MNLTPSSKGSFFAGVGLWCMFWAALFKVDEMAAACRFQRWVSLDRCLWWIRKHKSASLLGTELFNYGTHGISDPLGVTFALGGTVVNVLMIYVLLPMRERAKRGAALLNL
jgi:hypothetical protein